MLSNEMRGLMDRLQKCEAAKRELQINLNKEVAKNDVLRHQLDVERAQHSLLKTMYDLLEDSYVSHIEAQDHEAAKPLWERFQQMWYAAAGDESYQLAQAVADGLRDGNVHEVFSTFTNVGCFVTPPRTCIDEQVKEMFNG